MRPKLLSNKSVWTAAVLAFAVPAAAFAQTTQSATYRIEQGTFSSGGQPSASSANYTIQGTFGEPFPGPSAGAEYRADGGYNRASSGGTENSGSGNGTAGQSGAAGPNIGIGGGVARTVFAQTLPLQPLPSPISGALLESAADVIRAVFPKLPDVSELPGLLGIFPKRETPAPVPPTRLVSENAPLALRGAWNLMPEERLSLFVLSPLPHEISSLASKLPEFGRMLSSLGVRKVTDLEKLRGAQVRVPSISKAGGADGSVPANIVFASASGGLVDLAASLNVTDSGAVEQKIQAIASKPLKLSVRPDAPVYGITGYIAFRTAAPKTVMEVPQNSLAASALLALAGKPQSAEAIQNEIASAESKFIVSSFEYDDADGDGLYTAEVTAPQVEGEYEIINLIRYKDPELGTKALRLVAVIDPEGYVYERTGGLEARIPSVKVSIWKREASGAAVLWDAKKYNQENPQATDKTGKYSFLVPEGSYYITAEARGYKPYRSGDFDVTAGSGVHFNIELVRENSWMRELIDWRSLIVLILIAALLVNFHNDRRLMKRIADGGSGRRYP